MLRAGVVDDRVERHDVRVLEPRQREVLAAVERRDLQHDRRSASAVCVARNTRPRDPRHELREQPEVADALPDRREPRLVPRPTGAGAGGSRASPAAAPPTAGSAEDVLLDVPCPRLGAGSTPRRSARPPPRAAAQLRLAREELLRPRPLRRAASDCRISRASAIPSARHPRPSNFGCDVEAAPCAPRSTLLETRGFIAGLLLPIAVLHASRTDSSRRTRRTLPSCMPTSRRDLAGRRAAAAQAQQLVVLRRAERQQPLPQLLRRRRLARPRLARRRLGVPGRASPSRRAAAPAARRSGAAARGR